MPRALITGITGQDGSYLAELLLADGYEVSGVVRPGRERPPRADGVRLYEADLLDHTALRDVVHEAAPDELYHLAAPTFVPASWDDPAGTLAAIGGATGALLAAAAEQADPPRVLVVSSAAMFGDCGRSPQDECTPMRPTTPYGVAKLAAHALVQTMRQRYGLHASSAIAYNHESPRRPVSFLPRKVTRGAVSIKLGLERELVLGNLEAVRDWSHARDIVRGYHLIVLEDQPDDYVLASGTGRTVRELVQVAFGHVRLDARRHVRIDPALVRPAEPFPLVGNATKARERLGWSAETSFEETIAEMVEADLNDLLQMA